MYLEKFRVAGRVALVTGGGRGIGLGCVEALAEAGAKTILADHDPGMAESGRDVLRAKGYDPEIVAFSTVGLAFVKLNQTSSFSFGVEGPTTSGVPSLSQSRATFRRISPLGR